MKHWLHCNETVESDDQPISHLATVHPDAIGVSTRVEPADTSRRETLRLVGGAAKPDTGTFGLLSSPLARAEETEDPEAYPQ